MSNPTAASVNNETYGCDQTHEEIPTMLSIAISPIGYWTRHSETNYGNNMFYFHSSICNLEHTAIVDIWLSWSMIQIAPNKANNRAFSWRLSIATPHAAICAEMRSKMWGESSPRSWKGHEPFVSDGFSLLQLVECGAIDDKIFSRV